MNKYRIMKYIELFMLIVLLNGCGGGGSTVTSQDNNQQIAMNKIVTYASKATSAPTVDDFKNAGIKGVTVSNIDEINSIIKNSDYQEIDTKEEIQAIADRFGVQLPSGNSNIPNTPMKKGLQISEVLASNAFVNLDPDFKEFSDWIEIYNGEDHAIRIDGFYLSDDTTNIKKWQIPSSPSSTVIPQKGYLLIWADGGDKKAKALHSNFKLSENGDSVVLADKSGKVIDTITFDKQKNNISCAEINHQIVYMEPTPASANAQPHTLLEKSKKPTLDKQSGLYNGAQTITLSQENGGEIYYTQDGSIPTKQSIKYSTPLHIDKTTVIRARGLENGKFLSSVVNHTFLIDENVHLPVVSVAIDSKYLWDDKIGIYTLGTDDNGVPYPNPKDHSRPNYYQDWMRPGSAEYIKDGKSQFNENIGIKIHGNNTRTDPQKSLAIYAKDKYGSKSIDYPLFDDKPYIKKIKSFVLRSGGTEWGRTLIGDGIQHRIVKDNMDIDYQSFKESVVVFINGKYWGIHNIREKMNADYLEENHRVNPKNVDFLANKSEVQEGSNKDYNELLIYIDTHDMTNEADYNAVASKLDLTEYINYIIIESYVGNSSVHHNMKYWKEQKPQSRWRWLLFDLDRGFQSSDNGVFTAVSDNDETSTIFRNIRKNQNFAHQFASRYFTHLNTTFQTQRMDKYIKEAVDQVAPEIERHFQRWPKDRSGHAVSKNTWNTYINGMYSFSQNRNSVVIDALRTQFNLTGTPMLNIGKNTNGTVYIDDVALTDSFSGTYFTGATVTLRAVPARGYRFIKWSDNNTDRTRDLTINGNISLSPLFEAYTMPKIIINEINYASAKDHDSSDWIELYNNDITDADLSGWIIKDEKEDGAFIIPANTILSSHGYLVLTEKSADFKKQYPNVTNKIGDFLFGLSKKGDSIRVFNAQDMLVDQLSYDQSWPDANGNGKTLIRTDFNTQSWSVSSKTYGTPGTANQ